MKNIWKKIISGIFGLYFIAAFMVFTPYYNWQYAKTHGFMKWLLFGEVVATAKAVAWPYFVFAHSGGTILHVSNAINFANKATAVKNRGDPYQQVSQDDMEEIIGYYKKALAEVKQCDIKSMNQRYPGFGDHFKSEFMKDLELFISSYEKHDMMSSLASQALLDQWGNWYQANIDGIRGR